MSGIKAYNCIGDWGGQPMHCHEEVELIAVYRGQGRFQLGNACHTTGPGILSVACPQEPHAGTPTDAEFAVKVLNTSVEWFSSMGIDWRILWRKGGICEATPALALFLNVYETIEQGHSRLLQEEAFLRLIAAMQKPMPLPCITDRGRIEKAIALLHDRFTEEISLMDLAARTELNPSYFCRVFKKTVGVSPHAYQISLRVARAKTLLEQGKPPSEVAYEVGFYDQSHLNLHFKRLFSTTPSCVAKKSNSSYQSEGNHQ